MRKPSEFEIQEYLLLGGQISEKHQEFKEWAMQSPQEAFALEVIKKDFEKMTDEQIVVWILETHAKLQFLEGTTEITKLAMIVGDVSTKLNVRDYIDRLRREDAETE